ncbi:MAG: tetratricopeptide repeat protein [Bacteroidaceae bacterium]|nr:tetratricopeptide repeat protein [Bacteroidaceae bacterium]
MKKFIYTIMFAALSLAVSAQTDKIAADSAYVKGDYKAAIEIYESLVANNGESADVYYNLGNAYYKSENIAKAVLNYERALLLNPDDEDIRFNLELARSKTVDKVAPEYKFFLMEWLEGIINLFSISAWSVLAVVSFVVMLLTLLLFLFGKSVSTKKTGFIIALFSLFITIFANLSALHRYHYLTERNDAVIMEPSVTAKSTPSNSGTELFVIHEGRKVKISDDSMREWTEIELEDGNKGWIPSSSLERI